MNALRRAVHDVCEAPMPIILRSVMPLPCRLDRDRSDVLYSLSSNSRQRLLAIE